MEEETVPTITAMRRGDPFDKLRAGCGAPFLSKGCNQWAWGSSIGRRET